MSNWKKANLPLKSLYLWDENPRFQDSLKGASQKELINFLLKRYSLEDFGLNVIKERDLPQMEKLVIWDDGKRLNILEGNRRVATYLALTDPKVIDDPKIRIKFEVLKKEFDFSREYLLECLITNKKDQGLRFVDRKHFHSNYEESWGQYERDNYINRTKSSIQSKLTPKELRSILRAKLSARVRDVDLPVDTIKTVLGPGYVTNLFRILDSGIAQRELGYIKNGEDIQVKDEERFTHFLKAIVFNVFNEKDFSGNKINSRTLNTDPEKEAYLKSITALSNKKIDSIIKLQIGTISKKFGSQGSSTKGSNQRSQPASFTRKKLIVNSLTIKKNKKINDIYRELKDNKLEKETRYSIGVLLRVFIELSCEEYYFRRKPIPWDGSSLEKKFQSVLKDLEPNCDKDKRAKFHSIYNETFDQKNGSIIKLHKLIHERNYMIDENHLKSIWDTLEPVFIALYAKIK